MTMIVILVLAVFVLPAVLWMALGAKAAKDAVVPDPKPEDPPEDASQGSELNP